MESDDISICIVFRRAKAGQPANWPTKGARASGRTGSNVTGQLMTLIYLNICCDSVTKFSRVSTDSLHSGPL